MTTDLRTVAPGDIIQWTGGEKSTQAVLTFIEKHGAGVVQRIERHRDVDTLMVPIAGTETMTIDFAGDRPPLQIAEGDYLVATRTSEPPPAQTAEAKG